MAHATLQPRSARSLLSTPALLDPLAAALFREWSPSAGPTQGARALIDAPEPLRTASPFLEPVMGDYDEDDEDDDFFDDDTEGGGDEAAEEDDDFLDDEEDADLDEDEGSDDDDDDL